MICSNCKKTIADDALFCNYCGTKAERLGAPASEFFDYYSRDLANSQNPYLKN